MIDATLNREEILEVLRNNSTTIRDSFKVRRIGLFGSSVRDERSLGSDIDLLVEFDKNTFDNYMELKAYLENLFKREVDLVLSDSLKPRLRQYVQQEVVYAEGL
jgi:predicted nucleotidyltransferase